MSGRHDDKQFSQHASIYGVKKTVLSKITKYCILTNLNISVLIQHFLGPKYSKRTFYKSYLTLDLNLKNDYVLWSCPCPRLIGG